MKRTVWMLALSLAAGIVVGTHGDRLFNAQQANAQQEAVKRTVLFRSDLEGMEARQQLGRVYGRPGPLLARSVGTGTTRLREPAIGGPERHDFDYLNCVPCFRAAGHLAEEGFEAGRRHPKETWSKAAFIPSPRRLRRAARAVR